MMNSKFSSQAFELAELRSECTRIKALLGVFVCLLAILVVRGILSLAAGHTGETWPFILLLALVAAYELVWLKFVRSCMEAGREISPAMWSANIVAESLLPTTALFLQVRTSFFGPERALVSPVILAYFLLIVLSTLHLNPGLSRLCGAVSAAGYGAVCISIFVLFPEAASGQELAVYGASFSYIALLLLGGFAAGAVAAQIRLHVMGALREAESRARVERLEHDLGIARSIQQGLLPKNPPRVYGFDIAGWNQPADETGGDYYDWQQLADGQIAVTVADVTGHGIGPALCMAACRAYARAAFATESDLQGFLACLNQLMCVDLPPAKFVTLVAGVLNPRDSVLHLISAGHGPLFHYSAAEKRFHISGAQGLPLGLLKDFSYDAPQTIKLASGDLVILITDGFIEWANADDEEFGQNRLMDVIRANQERSSAAIISELYSAVAKFGASVTQADDLTALVIKKV